MNQDQKRHLATTLCMMEKGLVHKEKLLRSRGEKGALYEIVDTLHDGQRQELLARIAKLQERIALAKERFGLEVDQIDLRKMLVGELMMSWVWVRDTRTKALRGYGPVDDGLEHSLDPFLEAMAALIDETLKTLAEA